GVALSCALPNLLAVAGDDDLIDACCVARRLQGPMQERLASQELDVLFWDRLGPASNGNERNGSHGLAASTSRRRRSNRTTTGRGRTALRGPSRPAADSSQPPENPVGSTVAAPGRV